MAEPSRLSEETEFHGMEGGGGEGSEDTQTPVTNSDRIPVYGRAAVSRQHRDRIDREGKEPSCRNHGFPTFNVE